MQVPKPSHHSPMQITRAVNKGAPPAVKQTGHAARRPCAQGPDACGRGVRLPAHTRAQGEAVLGSASRALAAVAFEAEFQHLAEHEATACAVALVAALR